MCDSRKELNHRGHAVRILTVQRARARKGVQLAYEADQSPGAPRLGRKVGPVDRLWPYSCTSNNMTWLRSKIEAAVRGDEEED